MTTANTLINDAWELNGVPNASATRLTQGLRYLNDMLSGWAVEQLTIPFLITQTFSTVVAKGVYTIGENGTPDIDTVRPIDIADSMYITDSGDTSHRVFKFTKFQYNDISSKVQEGRPEKFAYDPVFPNANIYFDSLPTDAETVTIDTITQITEFAELTTTFSLPPEYKKIIKYNLALELAPLIGNVPDQLVVAHATKGLKKLKALNIQPVKPVRMDVAMTYSLRRGGLR